jgi:endopolyphosphatase
MLLIVKIFYFAIFVIILSFFGFFDYIKEEPIENEPELHGNFLHITDFHPDPHYLNNVSATLRCHHKHIQTSGRPDFMLKGISGPWGAPLTICDSPLNLIDATFDWLEKNWKHKLDFIIWTGDNSR